MYNNIFIFFLVFDKWILTVWGERALFTLHKCFNCWLLALPEKKTITKPLINSTFNHGLPEGPSYPVLAIIKELLRQFEC